MLLIRSNLNYRYFNKFIIITVLTNGLKVHRNHIHKHEKVVTVTKGKIRILVRVTMLVAAAASCPQLLASGGDS